MIRVEYGKRLKTESTYLRDAHSRDGFSQYGEDGIRDAIFERIGERSRWCVDIGADDGLTNSNTRELVLRGWSAVLIEAYKGAFDRMVENYMHELEDGGRLLHLVNNVANLNGSGLDALLSDTAIPENFDFLSLDIDGCEWHLWKAMQRYRPRVLSVEFNPTIANNVAYVQERDLNAAQGSSLLALIELGKRMGYELAATTAVNAFFVDRNDFPALGISDNSIDAVHDAGALMPVIFQDYHGNWVQAYAPRIWTTGARQ